MVHKAENVYPLALYIKSPFIPALVNYCSLVEEVN